MPESVPTISFDRRKASHVHPKLIQSLRDNKFFELLITFQTRQNDRTPTGDFNRPAQWDDVEDLVDIPCRRGVPESSQRQGNERLFEWGRLQQDEYVIVLNGYYPAVQAEMRAVTSDGMFIDIRGVLHDSASKLTTVTGRTFTPGLEGQK